MTANEPERIGCEFATDDERRRLVAVLLNERAKLAYVVLVKPGKYAGNHYHRQRTEEIYLIYGSAECQLWRIDDKGNTCQERSFLLETPGQGVRIPPMWFHKLIPLPQATLLVIADMPHKDEDTLRLGEAPQTDEAVAETKGRRKRKAPP